MSDKPRGRGPGAYDPVEIEPKWQKRWAEERTFSIANPGDPGFDGAKPKCYVLDMFPYPSGSGLHVGHPLGYCATDIFCRYKRMKGFNVLHPMGFDAFGLPAEQHAIETGVHPAVTTRRNIDTYRRQVNMCAARGQRIDQTVTADGCDPDDAAICGRINVGAKRSAITDSGNHQAIAVQEPGDHVSHNLI